MNDTIEYQLISKHYGDRVANRSQVPLINHINEGLIILDRINATDHAKRAYCLHPLLQSDEDLKENEYLVSFIEQHVLMLAMEYRSVANEYLSAKVNTGHKIRLSPLYEVNDMLVADKVQNYKDFIIYHRGTHPCTYELDVYFNDWLDVLDITEESFQNLWKAIDESNYEQTT